MRREPQDWIVATFLADYAQVAEGKLYVLGGGWSVCGPGRFVHALVIKLGVPWDQSNRNHTLDARLVNEDGEAVEIGDPPTEVALQTRFEVGRPVGLPPGTHLDIPIAVNMGPLELPPGRRYEWRLSVDGQPMETVRFMTRPQA
jgi:hypothetical protein